MDNAFKEDVYFINFLISNAYLISFLSRYGAIYQYENDGIEAAGDVDKG